jgi:predicted phage-related endonuclease
MIPQTDPAWIAARVGHLTASRFGDAIAKTKTGWSTSRRKLMIDLCAERMTGNAMDHYVTPAMQWGLDHEAEAWDAYEAASGNLHRPAGFFEHPKIAYLGATPDRLIEDGLGESKCPTTATHLTWLLNGAVPAEYVPQMLIQLACTGRKWCDFVSWDPRMPAKQRLFVRRFEPKPEEIIEAETLAQAFLQELEQMFRIVTTGNVLP